jgi:acetyl esterase/lipase
MNVPTLMVKLAALRGHPIPTSSVPAPAETEGSEVLPASVEHQIKRPKGVRLIRNVEYARRDGFSKKGAALRLRLDLMIPKAGRKHPLVVYVPGGGFVMAVKAGAAGMRRYVAAAGYVVASVEYRTTRHGATYPDGIADVREAIQYLTAHAEEYGIDPSRVAVWGESAGGYVASMVGLTNDDARLNPQRTHVAAVINKFGASSLERLAEGFDQETIAMNDAPGNPLAQYVHGPQAVSVSDDLAALTASDPISHISSSAPAFLLFHGTDDRIVSPVQTELLHRALRAAGADSTRYLIEGAGHGDIALKRREDKYWSTVPVMKIIVDFLGRSFDNSGNPLTDGASGGSGLVETR